MVETNNDQFYPTVFDDFNSMGDRKTGADTTYSGNGSGSSGSGSSGGSGGLGNVENGSLTYQPVQYAIPLVHFTYNALIDTTVAFTNKTLNTYGSCKWTFGDGQVSTEVNPRHKFPAPGTYQVKLVCWTPDYVKSGSKTITVTVGALSQLASFSSVVNTLEIIFTWTGTYLPGKFLWDFGDGTYSSEMNPRHTYSAAGTYTVTVHADSLTASSSVSPINPGAPMDFIAKTTGSIAGMRGICVSGSDVFTSMTSKINKYLSSTLAANGDFGDADLATSGICDQDATYIYVPNGTDIKVFNKSTGALALTIGAAGTGDGQFSNCSSVSVDSLYVYATDYKNTPTYASRVQIFNKTTGAFVAKWGSYGTGDGQMTFCDTIFIDGDYAVIGEAGSTRMQRFNRLTGAFVDKVSTGYYVRGMISFGDFYIVAAYKSPASFGSTLLKINRSSLAIVSEIGAYGAGDGSFNTPYDVDADDEFLYIADYGNARVQKLRKSYELAIPAPVAMFSSDVQAGAAPLTVAFTNLSTGDGLTYLWEFGDGTTSTSASPTHVFQEGTWTPRLTVTDSLGIVDETIGRIVATTAGTAFRIDPPIAKFTASPMIGSRDPGTGLLAVSFTDTSTGSPTTWSWKVNGVVFSTNQNPTRNFSSDGIYVIELTAGNAEGFTSTTSQTIIVTDNVVPEDNAPTSVITASQTAIFYGESVTFTADPSTPDVTYLWEFGDGSGSTEAAPTHTFGLPGTYEVILTTTNAWGSTETRMTIVVQGTVRFSGGAGADMGTYILDRKNHRILMYDENNTYAGAIGSFGSALGKFNNPTTIFVSRPIFNRR